MCASMTDLFASLDNVFLLAVMLPFYVQGGLRFRRWIVEGRPGIPRYSPHVETISLWLLYSSAVSLLIVILKQMMRHLG